MDHLSTEILLNIFSYLNVNDLSNLRLTCRRFRDIIVKWDHILLRNIDTCVTNQNSMKFLNRCPAKLSQWEKLRIEHNWKKAIYRLSSLLKTQEKFMPCVHLDKKIIWISRGNQVTQFFRKGSFLQFFKPSFSISSTRSTADVVKFVFKNDRLICGLRDGGIWAYSLKDHIFICDKSNCHASDVESVDISDNGELICSGGRDNFLKIWKKGLIGSPIYEKDFNDRIWCVRLNDVLNSQIAIGLSGRVYTKSLEVLDLNTMTYLTHNWFAMNTNSGISDIKWDSPFTFYTVGYDSCLRKWDLRSCSMPWRRFDPFDNTIYCVDCDNFNTVMTGHQLHGSVTLWDTRLLKKPLQVYFTDKKSPVYSLAFDATSLFALTDQHLNVFNFAGYKTDENKDYSDYLFRKIS